jgi:large subunit ribosomal protein L21
MPVPGCPAEFSETLANRSGSCYISFLYVGDEQEFAMYAVITDGSRQYRVSEGEVVQLDYRDAEPGSRVELNRVLLYQNGTDTRIGQPFVDGVRVLADVVGHPSTKTYIQHFRRRKNYRRVRGHRQPYTAVRVRYILLPGQEPPAAPPPAPAATEQPVAAPPPAPETPAPPPAPESAGTPPTTP